MSVRPSHLDELIAIIDTLRKPGGCPWDQKQTPKSITGYIIEEAYELVHAIESTGDIVDELGDVLLHIIMLCSMLNDSTPTTIQDVAKKAAKKMIRRHPHVFQSKKDISIQELHSQWEEIKQTEPNTTEIPIHAPALIQADHHIKKHHHTVSAETLSDTFAAFKKAPTKIAARFLYDVVAFMKDHHIHAEESLRQYVNRQ